MNKCIFCCVFTQEKYVEMFYLLLESIFIFGKLENTDILVYTSSVFAEKIKKSHFFNSDIKFEINDTYDNIDKACKARLDLFQLTSVNKYSKILYLDTDILIKDNINKVFDVCVEDILYVLEEGEINSDTDCWGKTLFGDEIYEDNSAFTSGILLFNNCKKIKDLFQKINEDITKRPYNFSCYDQPYIIYNAFKYNLYDNKILKKLAVNNDSNINSDKVIHHFPGVPGYYQNKLSLMNIFIRDSKKKYKLLVQKQCSIKELTNKSYTWEESCITFLDGFKMIAFGEGEYCRTLDNKTITAFFGGREHTITFNDDFTKFVSIRDDMEFLTGKVNISIANKSYSWENSYITFLDGYKMSAFGEGEYRLQNNQTISAFFGGREHSITFNDDFTKFISVRDDDSNIVCGNKIKISKHISFYFSEERIKYINNIIDETNKYDCETDIFIHTNIDLHNIFNEYTNGNITIIYHDLSDIHPYYLTWKCRELLQHQRNDYDVFMYIEDDILVPNKAIRYWLKNNKKMIQMNCNLGFLRIEVEAGVEYLTDVYEKFDTILEEYCVNNKNTYCAFWIYNKDEFDKFVDSKYYDSNNILGYELREQSGVGLHGSQTDWYKNTLIPIVNNKLIEDCKIYHMPNNYVMDKTNSFGTLEFNEAITL